MSWRCASKNRGPRSPRSLLSPGLNKSVYARQAVDERLAHSRRGEVLLPFAGHQPKGRAEFGVQGPRGVPMDIKTAATCRAVVRESCDKDEAARPNGFAYFGDVACAICGLSEKVEGSPVMPDGISSIRKRRVQNILLDPSDSISPRAEASAGHGQCCGREIEDREIVVARVQQVIDQR